MNDARLRSDTLSLLWAAVAVTGQDCLIHEWSLEAHDWLDGANPLIDELRDEVVGWALSDRSHREWSGSRADGEQQETAADTFVLGVVGSAMQRVIARAVPDGKRLFLSLTLVRVLEEYATLAVAHGWELIGTPPQELHLELLGWLKDEQGIDVDGGTGPARVMSELLPIAVEVGRAWREIACASERAE